MDDLSRIEATYGSVAEYNRVMYEENFMDQDYEPSEEEMIDSDIQMAIYNAKIEYLNGVPSEFVKDLKKEWDEKSPKEENFETNSQYINAGYDYSRDKKLDIIDKVSRFYNVEYSEDATRFYSPGLKKFGISVEYIDIGHIKHKFIGGLDYDTFKNVFRDFHYSGLHPTMSLGLKPDKPMILSNCSLGNLRIYDLKLVGFESNESINAELKKLGFDEEKVKKENMDKYINLYGSNCGGKTTR